MAKAKGTKTLYVCQECGHVSPRWLGRCPACEAWNSLVEEVAPTSKGGRATASGERPRPIPLGAVPREESLRIPTGLGELDRALGGGVVAGGVILVGGDPGVGKSTLLMQALAGLSARGVPTLYATGEESAAQVALRAERLGAGGMEKIFLLATTDLEDVEAAIREVEPRIVVVDSIQTLRSRALDSSPGSIAQLREVTARLVDHAKREDTALFLIGHVTKDGAIAGPKVLEHLVDTVLWFEGDSALAFRLLRATKNRFGPANEVGVFEMVSEGLREVADPSRFLLAERPERAPGSVVVPTAEGSRPLLVELQALVAPAAYGAARRVTSGLDASRLGILLAVLDRKAQVHVLDQDVFASIAGGIRVEERAIDLSLTVAVVSSLRNRPVRADTAVFGELGLAGEVRAVVRAPARIAEAKKLGMHRVILPRANVERLSSGERENVELIAVTTLDEALEAAF